MKEEVVASTLLTASLVLALALADSPSQISSQQEGAEPAAQRDSQPEPTPATPVNDQSGALIQAPCEPYPQTAEQADLCEQWRVAEAAEKTLTLTRVAVILGIVEVLTLLFVLSLNVKAIEQTQAALHADRAWITGKGFEFVAIEGGEIQAYLTCTNGGRSPAKDVWMFGACHVAARGRSVTFKRATNSGTNLGVVGPETDMPRLHLGTFAHDAVKAASAGQVHLVAHASAVYRDIYSETERQTECTAEAMVPTGNDDELKSAHFLNVAKPIQTKGWPTQNTAT